MVQTLADPQYQETVRNLSPEEQQHMEEQMGGMGSPEEAVTYMRGVVSFKQQHPGVSLTDVDGSFQRPPRSDHPAEQQGGDSCYCGAAAGGVVLGGGMLSTGGGYQRLGESALYQGEGPVQPQTMEPTFGDVGGEVNPVFEQFDSGGNLFDTRGNALQSGAATGDPVVDGQVRQRGGFQFTEENPMFAESGADVAAGEGASLLGGGGGGGGGAARAVGGAVGGAARFGAGRAVGGIVVVGGLLLLGGAAAVEVFGDDAPPSGNIGAPAAFTGRPPPPPPPDDTADTAGQNAVEPGGNENGNAQQDAVDTSEVIPGGEQGDGTLQPSGTGPTNRPTTDPVGGTGTGGTGTGTGPGTPGGDQQGGGSGGTGTGTGAGTGTGTGTLAGPLVTPGDPFGGNRPLQPLPPPREAVEPSTDSQALDQYNNRKLTQRAGAILMEEMLLPAMGPWALAIQSELDVRPEDTMRAAERVETEKGNSLLLDYVNANTRRVAPRSAEEKPRARRYQPTPLFKAARTETYAGSRWSGRMEQSKVTELSGSVFQTGKMAQTVWTGESLPDYKARQAALERRVGPRDLSHWL